MRATIVTIGDEIVGGQTADTNSAYIARRLGDLGIAVSRMVTIADDVAVISCELRRALDSADLIFVTGGLGATGDDVTKKALAEATERKLVVDRDVRKHLERRFKKHASSTREVIECLAMVPEGSRTIRNPVGAAPGLEIHHHGKRIYVLPGVPREMKAIFENEIATDLRAEATEGFVKTKLIRTVGIRESEVAGRLARVKHELGVKIGFLPGPSGVDLRLVASARDEAQAASALAEATQLIVRALGRYVYSTEGEDLHLIVGKMLIDSGRTIAVAESCTGGLIGHLLTEVPGISACLERVIVAYSDQAKVATLSIAPALIRKHGAVSSEVAEAMACGVKKAARTDLGISTTGIAGPSGGSKDKPVGLVYVALAHEGGCTVSRNVFSGTRGIVKHKVALHALDILRSHLLDTGE